MVVISSVTCFLILLELQGEQSVPQNVRRAPSPAPSGSWQHSGALGSERRDLDRVCLGSSFLSHRWLLIPNLFGERIWASWSSAQHHYLPQLGEMIWSNVCMYRFCSHPSLGGFIISSSSWRRMSGHLTASHGLLYGEQGQIATSKQQF